MSSVAGSILQGNFPELPENPGLAAARKAQSRARKIAAKKAQAEAAAAEKKALEEEAINQKIHDGVNQIFDEKASDPGWWVSGDSQLWLVDLCAELAKRAPGGSRKLCAWINQNAEISNYIFDTYRAAQTILATVTDIPDYELEEPEELVKEVQDQLADSLDDEFEYLLEPLVHAQLKLKSKEMAAASTKATGTSSSRRASSRLRQQDPAKVAARSRQTGALTSTLVDLLVNWNQKFGSAKDLYAALFTRGVTKPEDIADFEFVERAYEAFQVMQNTLAEVVGVPVTAQSLRAALDASEPLIKLKTQDPRMVHVIRALSQALIQKYARRAKIQKWAIRGAIGGTVALLSLLGSLRWLKPGVTQKQNPRRRQ